MTARLPDPHAVATVLRETAEAIVLPRFRALAGHEIIEKKPGDLVTIADIEAEAELERRLPPLMPGSIVIGEEAHHRDAAALQHVLGAEPVWIVDPIDGTVNFTEGKSTFCMMLVLVLGGQSVMSWIHDPLTGLTTIAEKGAGAERNGERLPRPIVPALDQMKGQINPGFFPKADRGRLYSQISRRIKTFASLRCAGHDFLGLATGHHHFSVYRRLWTWDHAPGVLIFREVGGVSERLDGGEYRVIDRVEGLLSAPDRDSWEVLRRLLLEPDAA